MSEGYHSNMWDQDCYWLFENLGSETQKIQMLAETTAVTFKKGKWRIFYILG